jgi:hypothetical protein
LNHHVREHVVDGGKVAGQVKSAKSSVRTQERAELEIEFSDGKVAVLLFESDH